MSLHDPNVVNAALSKRIAMVLANPAVSSTTGWPVGFWWSELTHPYHAFVEAGYQVKLFSPDGGKVQGDAMSDPNDPSGYSRSDLISQGFIHTAELIALTESTGKVGNIDVAAFDAIAASTDLAAKFVAFYLAGKIAAALCHGTAVLNFAKLPSGEYLAKGKTVTGFANVEEDFADNAVWDYKLLARGQHLMPWRIEDALNKIGANYVQAGLWRSFAVRDGNLITGQQNFSGAETARLVIEALGR
jgi:putative intracellular protease/amidase